ncbi:hypothetical protein, partial [Methylobacterium nigriterrae]|uniref:hypothetical protein n=1 Tax=Methylobacterium nigriterrae TaxID=3127512 RepID=UPI003013F683
ARSDAEGGSSIKVFLFDDVVRCSGDVYGKLDIEGAELAALHGMAKLLQQRPMLAVSVYHEPEHLWTIPQAIAALDPRPCLRLRQHLHNGFETVLYVTPGD